MSTEENKVVKTYISAGLRLSKDGTKLQVYYRFEKGRIIEEEEMLKFGVTKHTKHPVGWVVNITHEPDGQFSGFESTGEHIVDSRTAEWRLEHITTVKAVELKNLRKRKTNIVEMLEKMTLYELKKWANRSHYNKRMLRYYLLELF